MLKSLPKKALLLLTGDLLLIATAYVLSPFIRSGGAHLPYLKNPWTLLSVLVIFPVIFYLADLYDLSLRFRSTVFLYRVMIAGTVASVLTLTASFFLPELRPGRGIFLITSISIVIYTYAWRIFFEGFFKEFLKGQKKILIAGAGKSGKALYDAVKNSDKYKVVGYIDDDPTKWGQTNSPTVFGGSFMLDELISFHKVDAVVIAIPHLKSPEFLKHVLNCKMQGTEVYDMPTFYKGITGKLPVEHVDDYWFVNTPMSGVVRDIYTQRLKRVCDVAFSAIGLIVSMPISLVTALLIKIDSPGPVLFRQKRVGLNNNIFTMLKFRSMRADAEDNGAVWARRNDPRVTTVGKTIRKLRIDEIPQMWNVLKGDMSFIGPRPERPEFVDSLSKTIPYYSLRHSVKPGITGWAQVNYRYGASDKDALEKLMYDLFYINNLSAILEFQIFMRTIKVVLFGRGAR